MKEDDLSGLNIAYPKMKAVHSFQFDWKSQKHKPLDTKVNKADISTKKISKIKDLFLEFKQKTKAKMLKVSNREDLISISPPKKN